MSAVVAFLLGVGVALWAVKIAAQAGRGPRQLRRPLVFQGDTLRLEGGVYQIDGVILDGPHGVLLKTRLSAPAMFD